MIYADTHTHTHGKTEIYFPVFSAEGSRRRQTGGDRRRRSGGDRRRRSDKHDQNRTKIRCERRAQVRVLLM